jgi:hypothetical protein
VNINNAPKFLGILFVDLMVVILAVTNNMDDVAAAGLLGTSLGYLAGNGIAARNGQPVEPVFGEGHRADS